MARNRTRPVRERDADPARRRRRHPLITADTRVIAVDIPNTQAASALPWGSYRTTVDAIEASAGLNLFDRIPAALQNEQEGGVDSGPTE